MGGTVKIGRIFTSVHRNFIDDGNFQAWQVTLSVLLVEGVEDDLIRLSRDCHHLGLVTEGDVSDGVGVVVQTDVGGQSCRLVLLEQFLRPEPVDVLHGGVGGVPEPQTAVRVSRDQQLVARRGGRATPPVLPPGHRPVPATPASALPSPAAQRGQAAEQVGRHVGHVAAGGDRALLQVHCIGVLEAGQPRGLAVYGHQVVGQQDQDGLGVVLLAPPRRVGLTDEVHHAELHLYDGGVLPLQHRHAGLGPGHVLGQPAAEYQTTLTIPGDEPFNLREIFFTIMEGFSKFASAQVWTKVGFPKYRKKKQEKEAKTSSLKATLGKLVAKYLISGLAGVVVFTFSMGDNGSLLSLPFSLWGKITLAGFLPAGLMFHVTRLPSTQLQTNCLPSWCQQMLVNLLGQW